MYVTFLVVPSTCLSDLVTEATASSILGDESVAPWSQITTTDLQRTLVVINNSDAKITKFTDLLNGNYISMSVKVDEPGKHVVTPAVAVSTYNGDSSTVLGIQVRYYSNITEMNYGTYIDSKLSSDTVTTL